MIKFFDGELGAMEFYEIEDLGDNDFVMPLKYHQKKSKVVYEDYVTFDIETTTIDKIGYMYASMFYIKGKAILVRTWEDVQYIVNMLNQMNRYTIACYVHNLAFEFQNMKDFFVWDKVFATDKHRVIKATTDLVEFRCSYILTNKSLEKFLEGSPHAIHKKQSGDKFDYNKLRLPNSPLSDTALTYMYCDVVGLYEGLQDFFESDYNTCNIPMTSTGFVRNDCRKAIKNDSEGRAWLERTKIASGTYELLKEALRGGNTHGSYRYVGKTVHGSKGRDVTSSYPYVMLTKYFPDSTFERVRVDNEDRLQKYLNNKCCLFRIYLSDVRLKAGVAVPYLSFSKMTKFHKDTVCFNGRVITSSLLGMTLTEIDFRIIEEQYTFKIVAIPVFEIADRAELPQCLKNVVLQYFHGKCTLKGVDDYEYMKSKNKLNSCFGMACTDNIKPFLEWDGKEIVEKDGFDVKEEVEKYENSRRRFLPYPVGIWVTAHAREHLEKMFRITAKRTLYGDTDSDKYIPSRKTEKAFKKLNHQIGKEAIEKGAYCDYNGKRFVLGVYENDGFYRDFKTNGAKRYVYTDLNNKFHSTIAGVNKKKGGQEIQEKAKKRGISPFDVFSDGMTLTESAKNCVYYNEDVIHTVTIEGCTFTTASNCGIMKEEFYTMSMTEEMKTFIDTYQDKEIEFYE